jgi:hypothetical protein
LAPRFENLSSGAQKAADGGDCMERGYDCPGNQICMVCKTVSGAVWICVPPGVAC